MLCIITISLVMFLGLAQRQIYIILQHNIHYVYMYSSIAVCGPFICTYFLAHSFALPPPTRCVHKIFLW